MHAALAYNLPVWNQESSVQISHHRNLDQLLKWFHALAMDVDVHYLEYHMHGLLTIGSCLSLLWNQAFIKKFKYALIDKRIV